MSNIEIIQGDITQLQTDAIVNAANESLLGGGGVDGAIHRAAGPQLKEYNKKLGGCPTGEARISPGFHLPASHVISTVGPVWNGGNNDEKRLLANCYKNSLLLADENKLTSIAFPAISTGVYGYPFTSATQTAISTIKSTVPQLQHIQKIVLVFFNEQEKKEAESLLNDLH